VRELDADSDDGVGVLNTGVSPSFAPGMGSAKAMRGVTVAPLSSTLISGSESPDGLEPPVRDESAGVRPFSVDLATGSERSAEEAPERPSSPPGVSESTPFDADVEIEEAPFHEEEEDDDDDFHLEFGVIEPKLPTHALEADSGIDEIWTAISATEERMLGSGEHAPATAASSDAMTPRPDEGTFQTVALSSAELKELTQRQGSGSATPLLPTEEDRGGAELEPDLDRLTGSIDLSSIAIPDSGVRLDSASWTPPAPSELDAPPPPLLAPRPPKPPAGGGESKERSISSGESWSNRALESSAALRGLGERDIHSGLSPPAAGSVSPGAAPSAATRDSSAMRRRPDLPPQKRSSQTLPKKAQSSPPRLMELTILLVLAVGIIVAYIYGQDLYQRLTVVAPTPEPAGDPSLGEPPAPIFESLDPNDEAVSLLDLSRIQDGVPLVDVRVATPVASPVTNILRITYGSYEERGTEIVLWGDGSFSALNTSLLRLPGEAPRQLVRVGGIEAPHPNPSYILESSSEVTALRIEYHIADPYNEVQLVAELGSAEVQLVNVQVVDRRLILRFERLTPRRRR
jgi:hypothetical protein